MVILTSQLEEKINEIYLKASELTGFPERCSDATRLLESLGFAAVSGKFLLDKSMPWYSDLLLPHVWAVDELATIVDLTAYQFNEGLIVPIKPGVLFVGENSALRGRYIPDSEASNRYRNSFFESSRNTHLFTRF